MSKQLAEHLQIPTAKWVVASSKYPLSAVAPFNGPYFVKPRFGSASIGIDESCLCETWQHTIEKANSFLQNDIEVIVEEYINGIYYGVPILNNTEIPLIAVPHFKLLIKSETLSLILKKIYRRRNEAIYMSNEGLNKILKYYSNMYFMQMQPCDYARIDYIVEKILVFHIFLKLIP